MDDDDDMVIDGGAQAPPRIQDGRAEQLTKEEQMQRLIMKHFFTSQMRNNDSLARMAII